MSWIAVAIGGGAILGAVASNNAANKQADAAANAAAITQGQYDQTRTDLQPFVQGGYGAQNRLSDLLGTSGNVGAPGYGGLTKTFTANDYLANQDPGYQFQLQQGQQALQNSQAAQNGVLGGAALKGLIGYSQGMAATGYNDAFNRFQTSNQNTYNRLAGLLQVGENAAAQTGTVGANLAGSTANSVLSQGNAAASGIMGGANAISGGINSGLGYYQMSQMMGGGSGGGGAFTGGGMTAIPASYGGA